MTPRHMAIKFVGAGFKPAHAQTFKPVGWASSVGWAEPKAMPNTRMHHERWNA